MWEVLLEALIDSLKILPFLFAFFVLIELLESNKKAQTFMARVLNGKAAPVFGGLFGVIPQCGFSVMTADLFLSKKIKMGTLIAVLVATSDEALPLLFTNATTVVDGFVMIAIKIGYAILLGFVINLFDKSDKVEQATVEQEHNHSQPTSGCCQHHMHEKQNFWQFIKHPIIHTAKIFVFIVVVSFLFGTLIYFFEQQIIDFMSQTLYLQPVVVCLIGLIPNCGSSVLITELYLKGIISFSAMTAGLVSNSGIAVAVLLRKEKGLKSNLPVVAILYLAGVVLGLILTPFGLF